MVHRVRAHLRQEGSDHGFGTFETRKRKAREGRNPQTGERIKIAASRFPAFHAGKALKDEFGNKGFPPHKVRAAEGEPGPTAALCVQASQSPRTRGVEPNARTGV
jgi:hypothetical protein